jgi:hypothetical protein
MKMSATKEQVQEAIADPRFSHARRGDGCWRDVVWIYHRDEASPSGFKLAVGADAAVADPILRDARQTSALSPTER